MDRNTQTQHKQEEYRGELFEKLILKTVHKYTKERNLLSASQFGFRERHSTTLQYMRLTDHVTLNFNYNMSTAVVFLDIEKAFDTTWHPGLLYKLLELTFSASLMKLIASFLSNRKFKVSVEGELSSPRKIAAGVPQGSVLAPVLYSLYINDVPAAPGIQLALFADDTCIYASEKHERRVLNKLQRGLTAVGSWCENWNIKINEGKTQAIYFSRRRRNPENQLQLNGRNIPFVNSAKYLGVIFDRRMTWRLHIERTTAKALGTYIRTYSLFKSKQLSANVKLILYRALIRSIMTYACPTWESAADTHLLILQCLQKRVLCVVGNLDRPTSVRDLHLAFKIPYVYDYITCWRQAEVIQNHPNPNVHATGQGEATHRKHKRLKLGVVRRTTVQVTDCHFGVVVLVKA
jgi:hypothetical protein